MYLNIAKDVLKAHRPSKASSFTQLMFCSWDVNGAATIMKIIFIQSSRARADPGFFLGGAQRASGQNWFLERKTFNYFFKCPLLHPRTEPV